jgi:hypothetical protein
VEEPLTAEAFAADTSSGASWMPAVRNARFGVWASALGELAGGGVTLSAQLPILHRKT